MGEQPLATICICQSCGWPPSDAQLWPKKPQAVPGPCCSCLAVSNINQYWVTSHSTHLCLQRCVSSLLIHLLAEQ
jgi:hypothetical protein